MNVALRLAAFGIDTQLLTRVGNDDAGHELMDYMAAGGLAIDHVQIDSERPTGRVNVDTKSAQSVRYEILAPAAWDFIDVDEYLASVGTPCEVVVFGSLAAREPTSRGRLMRLLEHAQLRVFDVNLRPPFDERAAVEPLLRAANWAKLNEDELTVVAQWLGESGSPQQMLVAIGEQYEIDLVCATFGSRGAMMLHERTVIEQQGFDVAVVDTIGCGDAFLGAWLAQMLDGVEPARALERACAAGAVVASAAGANPAVTDAMIDAVIASARC
jgi:fructokinase